MADQTRGPDHSDVEDYSLNQIMQEFGSASSADLPSPEDEAAVLEELKRPVRMKKGALPSWPPKSSMKKPKPPRAPLTPEPAAQPIEPEAPEEPVTEVPRIFAVESEPIQTDIFPADAPQEAEEPTVSVEEAVVPDAEADDGLQASPAAQDAADEAPAQTVLVAPTDAPSGKKSKKAIQRAKKAAAKAKKAESKARWEAARAAAAEAEPEQTEKEAKPAKGAKAAKDTKPAKESKPAKEAKTPKGSKADKNAKAEKAEAAPAEEKPKLPSFIKALPLRTLHVPLPGTTVAQEELSQALEALKGGRLTLFLSGLCAAASVVLLVSDALRWHPLDPIITTVLSIVLMLLTLLVDRDVLQRGYDDLRSRKPGLYSMLLLPAALSLLQPLFGGGAPFCPAVSLAAFYLQRALHSRKAGHYFALHTLCEFEDPVGIYEVPAQQDDAPGLRRGPGDTREFLSSLQEDDDSSTTLQRYVLLVCPLTLVLATALSLYGSLNFLTSWLSLLLASLPIAAMLSYSRPFYMISRRLSKRKGTLSGWQSAKLLGGKHTMLLRDEDLFSQDNVMPNGMKLFGSYQAGHVLGGTLAALKVVESPLVPIFEQLLQEQFGKHLPTGAYRIYDNGGIGVEAASDVVLVGTLPFMRSMGVHMPKGTQIRQALYTSINGELAAVFALKYKPSASTKKGLRDVIASHSIRTVLATRDFVIEPDLIAAKYDLNASAFVFPDYNERIRLSGLNQPQEGEQAGIIGSSSFGAYASTVAAGRSLHTVTTLNLVLALMGGVIGLVLCALLLFWGSPALSTAFNVVAFQLVWAILSFIVTFISIHF